MRYRPIPSDFFTSNRKKLKARLRPNSVVVVRSNDIMPTNADGTMVFKQNSNLLYLTGVDQEDSCLILAPDFPDGKMREILFLKETNKEISIWEGHKLTKEEGRGISGIDNIKWNQHFDQVLRAILAESENIYLEGNEHIRNTSMVETANDRFVKECMNKYPLYEYRRLAPLINDLRAVKAPEEVNMIEHACQITEKGFRRVLDVAGPGVWEYQLEAEYAHVFLANRSKGFAYAPIIAGGFNACALHYTKNNCQLKDGDLLLMDAGAEYANYNADMTRTIPVSGRFTARQRAVYDAALRVKNQATALLRPGIAMPEYHAAAGELMSAELLELGLLDKSDIKNQDPDRPAYKKYFMHGTSHHLGLDVHDVASSYKKIEPGMVLTVEPGIYIREEGIGVRLEDNILITEEGHKNLMGNIPIQVEEIEDLMNRNNG